MAWVFEKSATWRRIVKVTKQSPLAMASFTVACCVIPYYGGQAVLGATNPEVKPEKEREVRQQMSMHQKAMARVNRERLAILLEESRSTSGSGNDRYAAALRGESLGTHKGGTTVGARGVQPALRADS